MEITLDELTAAEADLRATKAAFHADRADANAQAAYEYASAACALTRSAYRSQESQAGRRVGFVGGDAFKEIK